MYDHSNVIIHEQNAQFHKFSRRKIKRKKCVVED